MCYLMFFFLAIITFYSLNAEPSSQAVAAQTLENLEAQKKEAQEQLAANKNSFFSLFNPYVEDEIKRLEGLILELEQEKIPAAKKALEEIDFPLTKITLQQTSLSPGSLDCSIHPLPIADWLNVSQIQRFFKLSDQPYLEIQPYAFSSDFHLHHTSFNLKTLGIAIQGGVNLAKRWAVGGGVGYFYSDLDYASSFKESHINTAFAGPFVAYLCEKGYVRLRFLGAYNTYAVQENTSEGWDFDTQLEGGIDFEVQKFFGPRFFITPNVKCDYLMVFQDKNNSTFFSSRLAVQFLKEFLKGEEATLIPSLSLGWVLMQPLSQKASCYTYQSCNQTYVAAALAGVHKRGIALSCGFEGYFGKLYPVYAYTLKLSLDL